VGGDDECAVLVGVVRVTARGTGSRLAIAAAIAVVGTLSQIGLHAWIRSHTRVEIPPWSSEHMVQTVSIVDLHDAPVRSLWNLHIQPPMFDAIRALLAQLWNDANPQQLLSHVDGSLLLAWAGLYGCLAALLYLWLMAAGETRIAVAATTVWMFHPAPIFYATLLETTLLSSLLVTGLIYCLWHLRRAPDGSIAAYTVVAVALFFTRSLFQWPAIFVFGAALWLVRVSLRRVAVFLLICGGLAGLYLAKQYVKFGILSTSSISGLSLTHAAGLPDTAYYQTVERADRAEPRSDLPSVLTRARKLDGTPNLNHYLYLDANRAFLRTSGSAALHEPLRDVLRTYRNSLWLYFLPSDWFALHPISEQLPWRRAYNFIFSSPVLPVLLALAAVCWWKAARAAGYDLRDYGADAGLLLPVLYVAVVSILADVGENMRFKFFLEPVLFLFIVIQLSRVRRSRPTSTNASRVAT